MPEARAEHGDALRTRILEVAAPKFAAEGYGGTSMREIAVAAHCTKPALYYHFGDKRALFLTLIREETDRINEVLEVALGAPCSVRERLRMAIEAYVQHVRERRVALTLLLRAQLHAEPGQPEFDFRARRRVHIEAVTHLLREGARAGEIHADTEVDDAVMALIGTVEQRCILFLLDDEPIPEGYPERVLKLLFRGLAP